MKRLRFMEENLANTLQIKDFCSALHFSEASLHRFCKKHSGMTVIDLFRKMKCVEADRLLLETTLTIGEIGEKRGFRNGSHFSTMYKRMEGVTPLEKRRKIVHTRYSKKEAKFSLIRNNYHFIWEQ